ncbi:hypothetical protein B0H19DRAFT_509680 [Mycena capillaripes]|nr:hypothetical protein B0H19DRAFT_509680 [Mycena capillaripes]
MNPPYLDERQTTISDDYQAIWNPYYCDEATSQLVTGDAPGPLKAFVHGTSLSIVAVIINAASKIEHAERNQWLRSAEVLEVKTAINSFKLEFFYLPSALLVDKSSPSDHSNEDSNDGRATPKPSDRMDEGKPPSDDRMEEGSGSDDERPGSDDHMDQGSGSDREGSCGNQHDKAKVDEEEEDEEEDEEEELEEEDNRVVHSSLFSTLFRPLFQPFFSFPSIFTGFFFPFSF